MYRTLTQSEIGALNIDLEMAVVESVGGKEKN